MGIHRTAVISDDFAIDPSVEIGPNVIVEKDVKIHPGVKIMANSYICSGTEIGEGTVIHMGAVIGNVPQDYSYKGEKTFTKIGKGNIIREYVTIHRGTGEGTATVIGDNNMFMVSAHVGHNCKIDDNVIIANGTLLAGHVHVESGAFISGNVVFHQFCKVGKLAMIGGFSGVNKDVPPYMLVRGPSAIRGVNLVGLRRSGMSREAIKEIRQAFKTIFLSKMGLDEAVQKVRQDSSTPEIEHLIKFIEQSKRKICVYKFEKEEYF